MYVRFGANYGLDSTRLNDMRLNPLVVRVLGMLLPSGVEKTPLSSPCYVKLRNFDA